MPSVLHRMIPSLTGCLLAAALAVVPAWEAQAGGHHRNRCPNPGNCRPVQYGQPDLFANYYVPGTCGGVPAQMYPAPHYVPPMAGYTYVTYQPLMPHELLYTHHRSYYRYYDGGRGMTRASVHWYNNPIASPLKSMKHHFRIAR